MKGLPIIIAFIIAFVAIAAPAAGEVPCELPGVTARVDPEVAAPGEPIVVTLCNNSSSTVNLPTSCVFEAVYASGGSLEPFYTAFCPQVITPIEPGQSISQSWDQRGDSGEQAPDGTYVFWVRTGSGVSDFLTPQVTIAADVPASMRWGVAAMIAALGLAGCSMARARSQSRR